MSVQPGIITNGLGGNASNLILGQFNLGFFEITIEELPPVQSGGGTSPKYYDAENAYRRVKITVRYRGKTWIRVLKWQRYLTPLYINIIDAINKITTNIQVAINSIRKLGNKIRIK